MESCGNIGTLRTKMTQCKALVYHELIQVEMGTTHIVVKVLIRDVTFI